MLKLHRSSDGRSLVSVDSARRFTVNIVSPSFCGQIEDNFHALQILTVTRS